MSAEFGPELAQVDALLRRAADAFVYPATPPIATHVAERARDLPAPTRRAASTPAAFAGWLERPAFRVAAIALTAALLIAGAALAVPQSRTALAKFFGLSHVRVEVGATPGPTPRPLSPNSFAKPASLAEAQTAVDFPLRLPTRDGARLEPDAVYVQAELPAVIFVYEREGFDLYETRSGFFRKGLPDQSLIHEITFDGTPALWIDQGGHIAEFLDAEGRLIVQSLRSVDRATLFWEQNGITYRLETSLSQAEAIEIAQSLQ